MTEVRRIQQEHVELRGLLAGARKLAGEGGPGQAEALRAQLERLAQTLFAHFEREEEGGLFSDLVARRPELDGRVSRLLEQHRALREGLSALLERVEPAGLIQVLDSLERHEQEETQLLQDGLLTDLGTDY